MVTFSRDDFDLLKIINVIINPKENLLERTITWVRTVQTDMALHGVTCSLYSIAKTTSKIFCRLKNSVWKKLLAQ